MSAAALPIAALAMQVVGGAVQGAGADAEARADARALEHNALLTQQAGEQDAYDIAREERQMSGEALAFLGGAGVQLGTGSAADILADAARQRERDVRVARTRAANEAANQRQAARDRKAQGKNALIGAAFGGVATALAGASDLRRQRLESGHLGRVRQGALANYGTSYGSGR